MAFIYWCVFHAERLVIVIGISFLAWVLSAVLVPHQDFAVEAVVMPRGFPPQALSDANVTCPLAAALTVGIGVELVLFRGFPMADMTRAE